MLATSLTSAIVQPPSDSDVEMGYPTVETMASDADKEAFSAELEVQMMAAEGTNDPLVVAATVVESPDTQTDEASPETEVEEAVLPSRGENPLPLGDPDTLAKPATAQLARPFGLSDSRNAVSTANDVEAVPSEITVAPRPRSRVAASPELHELPAKTDSTDSPSANLQSHQIGNAAAVQPVTPMRSGERTTSETELTTEVLTELAATKSQDSRTVSQLSFETPQDQSPRPGADSLVALPVDSLEGATSEVMTNTEPTIELGSPRATPSVLEANGQTEPSINRGVPSVSDVGLTLEANTVSAPKQISDHLLTAHQSIQNGTAKLEVTLDPPELGKITVELTETDERLTAKLIVSDGATLESVRRSVPAMIESLLESGLSIDDFQLESPPSDGQSNDDPDEPNANHAAQVAGSDAKEAPGTPSNQASSNGINMLA